MQRVELIQELKFENILTNPYFLFSFYFYMQCGLLFLLFIFFTATNRNNATPDGEYLIASGAFSFFVTSMLLTRNNVLL